MEYVILGITMLTYAVGIGLYVQRVAAKSHQ